MKTSRLSIERRAKGAIIRGDFGSFVSQVFRTLCPAAAYDRNWHINAICHRLEQVRRGEIKRFIICVPPRSMKSMMCSVAFPAYVLGHEPTKRIICISYSSDLAIRLGLCCHSSPGPSSNIS